MNQSNSTFKHPERASYELGFLLRSLPQCLHVTSLNAGQLEEIEAADRHAANCKTILLGGLQSLGRVLWSASTNEEHPAHSGDCARIGQLVTELALQIEFLSDFREEVAEHNLRNAQKGRIK